MKEEDKKRLIEELLSVYSVDQLIDGILEIYFEMMIAYEEESVSKPSRFVSMFYEILKRYRMTT